MAGPVVIAIIFFVVIPSHCSTARRRAAASRTNSAAAAEGVAAPIRDTADFDSRRRGNSIDYPAGLDEKRIGYLIEVDLTFSEPKHITIPRTSFAGQYAPAPVRQLVDEGKKMGWFSVEPNGDLVLTSAGLVNLDGVQVQGDGWSVPVAKRKFDSVVSIKPAETNGNYQVHYLWTWETNRIGSMIYTPSANFGGTAEFGGGERRWNLVKLGSVNHQLQ